MKIFAPKFDREKGATLLGLDPNTAVFGVNDAGLGQAAGGSDETVIVHPSVEISGRKLDGLTTSASVYKLVYANNGSAIGAMPQVIRAQGPSEVAAQSALFGQVAQTVRNAVEENPQLLQRLVDVGLIADIAEGQKALGRAGQEFGTLIRKRGMWANRGRETAFGMATLVSTLLADRDDADEVISVEDITEEGTRAIPQFSNEAWSEAWHAAIEHQRLSSPAMGRVPISDEERLVCQMLAAEAECHLSVQTLLASIPADKRAAALSSRVRGRNRTSLLGGDEDGDLEAELELAVAGVS